MARDPLGYPFIRGTMLKGALKTRLGQAKGCIRNSGNMAVVDCSRCGMICCLLGRELGDGAEGASHLSLGDLYPLLIPGPAVVMEKNGSSGDPLRGVVYVTSDVLLSKARAYTDAVGGGLDGIQHYLSCADGPTLYLAEANCREGDQIRLLVSGQLVEATIACEGSQDAWSSIKDLNPLYESYPPNGRILVLPADLARPVIDRLLDRVTRVALDRYTKTVRIGALWTEEYLPWGTLFLGIVADTGFTNNYCNGNIDPLNELRNLLNSIGGLLVVGGKESVGAGLLRVKLQ